MSTSHDLIEQKLINNLVNLRNEFIETNITAILYHKKAIELSQTINSYIPSSNAGYIDDFGSVFHSISSVLCENTRNRARPKEASITSMSDDSIRQLITKEVDRHLWSMMFNRLGFFKMMSSTQIDNFKTQCKTAPMPFTLDVIYETLANIAENKEDLMIEALYDTFNDLKSTYVSNNSCMFGNKVIIDGSFLEYGDSFKLKTHEKLETLLEIVWRWILVNKWEITENGVNSNQIWDDVSNRLKNSNQDYDLIKSIESFSIEFRFFKNKNVHVLFPPSMIALLNSQLAKKNYLANK